MTKDELKAKIQNLSIWKKKEERAPHKPLLILYALGQLQANAKQIAYQDAKEPLKDLLLDFGPQRKSYHPEHPFVRLSKDGIWELNKPVSDDHIKSNFLIQNHITGGFTSSVLQLLKNDKELVKEVAEIILWNHFPETMHEDILLAVGLDLTSTTKRIRNADFRSKILIAYEYKCAICGFNARLNNTLVAVDAAHVKWFQAGGPDIEENGIALCAMHHKLFDRGVFTINTSRQVIVSQSAHGDNGFKEWVMKYHGKEVTPPISPNYQLKETYLVWHVAEVFKGLERPL